MLCPVCQVFMLARWSENENYHAFLKLCTHKSSQQLDMTKTTLTSQLYKFQKQFIWIKVCMHRHTSPLDHYWEKNSGQLVLCGHRRWPRRIIVKKTSNFGEKNENRNLFVRSSMIKLQKNTLSHSHSHQSLSPSQKPHSSSDSKFQI